jgi:hypothetical protein
MRRKLAVPTVKRLTYALGTRTWRHKRCEALVAEATARWRNLAGKDYRCELSALYVVDDQYLCKRHAGDYLIQNLLNGEHVVAGPTRSDKSTSSPTK